MVAPALRAVDKTAILHWKSYTPVRLSTTIKHLISLDKLNMILSFKRQQLHSYNLTYDFSIS